MEFHATYEKNGAALQAYRTKLLKMCETICIVCYNLCFLSVYVYIHMGPSLEKLKTVNRDYPERNEWLGGRLTFLPFQFANFQILLSHCHKLY